MTDSRSEAGKKGAWKLSKRSTRGKALVKPKDGSGANLVQRAESTRRQKKPKERFGSKEATRRDWKKLLKLS